MKKRRPPLGSTYAVGYCRTAEHTRFQPGQSGNPRGRPRGSRNKPSGTGGERLKAIVLAEAYREIKIKEGEKQVTMPIMQGVVRSLVVSAAKGQTRPQKILMEMIREIEGDERLRREFLIETAMRYQVDWQAELARRKRLGIDMPDPVPHPDDIAFDLKTGEVRFLGPITDQDKAIWEELAERRDMAEKEMAAARADLAEETDPAIRAMIEKDINFAKAIRDRIIAAIGNWPHHREPHRLGKSEET